MDVKLEPRRVEHPEQLGQLVQVEHDRGIAAGGVGIVLEHRRGAVLQHAVEEELRRVDPDIGAAVVAAQRLDPAERVGHRLLREDLGGGGDPQGEIAGPVETAIDLHVALFDQGVEHAGDAVAIAQRLAEPHAVGVALERRLRQPLEDPADGVLVGEPGGYALTIAHELAVAGIGDAGVEADRLAPLGVERGIVAVGGEDEAGPVGHRLVQHLAGQVVRAEDAGIPADAVDPELVGLARRVVAHDPLQLGDRARRFQVGAGGELGAAVLQVDMGVLEPRQDQPAAGVDLAGAPVGERPDLGVLAERQDAAAAGGQRPRPRSRRIHGADVGVEQDQVGGRHGGHGGTRVRGRRSGAPRFSRGCRKARALPPGPVRPGGTASAGAGLRDRPDRDG